MIETIGKPGTCIRPIDRDEILIALGNLLDKRKEELERTKVEFMKRGIIRPKDIYKNPSIIIFENMIESTKNTRDRVINTPECWQEYMKIMRNYRWHKWY